ncbi:MAG TPA: putative glycoside hydrolase, partial [Polyangia bacterium]
TKLLPYTPKSYPDHGLFDPMTEAGRKARGLYITPMFLFSKGAERTAAIVSKAHLNAVVIDMKDDKGNLVYPTRIPLGEKQRYVLIKDPAAMVRAFHQQGIYVIGRVVSFKDSRLPLARPDLGVRSGRRAQHLFSAGARWLDAYSSEVQDYLIDVATELQGFGFDEIQFDYIRFPKGNAGTVATWLHQDKRVDRSTLITRFLEKADRALSIPISADVYGLTTLVDGDPRTLGQTIESMAKYIEAVSPMMYANGMGSYFRNQRVTEDVVYVIECGLRRARVKAGGIALRPYLQAYANSVENFWGPQFVASQLRAAERAGADGFLLWNPTMHNEIVFDGIREMKKSAASAPARAKSKHAGFSSLAWCPKKGDVFGAPARRPPTKQLASR